MTGTDEHGQKIEDCAKAAGITPQAYVDNIAGQIRGIWDLMGTSYDQFIRTTDPKHERVVQKSLKSSTIKATSIKAAMKAGTASPVSPFSPKHRL